MYLLIIFVLIYILLAFEAPISESSFSWSDIAFDEFAEEKPKKEEKPETPVVEEDHVYTESVPQRPVVLPAEEPAQEEEISELILPNPFDEPYYMTGSQTPKYKMFNIELFYLL